ncbi:MEKHLA domain-containing protein [Pseudomonas sp. QL9]|uniref:MEKHLA domain-containing protein n=1 Tax=Pseudomonas sp. QL9 TaxID=3242725 RepID=UPI00352B7B2D
MSTAQQLLQQIDAAYQRLHGKGIGADIFEGEESGRLRWLHEAAPFALLAHDASADPRFIYVNAAARQAFGYREEEFIGLPSRLSADADAQADRDAILASVRERGFAEGYAGTRIRKDGSHFRIERGELWQLDEPKGQAALVWAAD